MFKCRFIFVAVLVLGCLCILNAPALAVNIVMTGDNGGNQSSYNQLTNWSNGLAPSYGIPPATNDYFTNGYLMRSPVAAPGGAYLTGNQTFLGDSLTIGRGNNPVGTPGYSNYPFLTDGSNGGGNNTWNNSLMAKANGVNMIVNNLILDAGYIRDGMGGGQTYSINGNITVTANGGGFVCQALQTVNSALHGSGPIYIGDQGNVGDTGRGIFFASGLSDYTGNIIMPFATANRSRFTLTSTGVLNFANFATPGSGNNSISVGSQYAEFAGAFNINLTGASTTLGDSWTIVSKSTGSSVYDATFTVNGFNDIGGDLWKKSANGTWYQFDESVGTLTVVPEPATMVLLGLGSLALLRRRKS